MASNNIKPSKYPVGPDEQAELFDQAVAAGRAGKQDTLVSGTNIKTINGASVLGSGDLSISSATSWGTITGTLSSQTDLNTALSGKASTGAVTGTGITMSTASILGRSTSGTGAIEEISIGTGLTLSAGTLSASGGGLTVGTTAIASGTIGRVLFQGTGNVLQQSANLFWDNTNGRLGIGTASPNMSLDVRTGNVGIGVTSNAGFRLDVNGTARVQSGLTISGQTANNYLTIGTGTGNAFFTWSAYFLGVNGVKFRSEYLIGDPSGAATGVRASAAIDSRGYLVTDSIGIGTTTNTINASAIAQIDSTTKGFLPPRMTTTQKNAITSPAAGLVVYDTTLNKLCVRTASAWETITSI